MAAGAEQRHKKARPMADNSLICRREGCGTPVQISDAGSIHRLMLKPR